MIPGLIPMSLPNHKRLLFSSLCSIRFIKVLFHCWDIGHQILVFLGVLIVKFYYIIG